MLNEELINDYRTNPMHLRTIKLFRWHLEKQNDFEMKNIETVIEQFQIKYDIKKEAFLYPILIALTNSTIETDLIMLIHSLGKQRVMQLLDDYLKSKINK